LGSVERAKRTLALADAVMSAKVAASTVFILLAAMCVFFLVKLEKARLMVIAVHGGAGGFSLIIYRITLVTCTSIFVP
jgi:hypothetical protein